MDAANYVQAPQDHAGHDPGRSKSASSPLARLSLRARGKDASDILRALEGLFVQLSLNVETDAAQVESSWLSCSEYIVDILLKALVGNWDVIKSRVGVAKTNSDHLRKTTSNKIWLVTWNHCAAEMLVQYRKEWENDLSPRPLSELFLEEWDTPVPRCSGVCFTNVYLDENWQLTPKSPVRS